VSSYGGQVLEDSKGRDEWEARKAYEYEYIENWRKKSEGKYGRLLRLRPPLRNVFRRVPLWRLPTFHLRHSRLGFEIYVAIMVWPRFMTIESGSIINDNIHLHREN